MKRLILTIFTFSFIPWYLTFLEFCLRRTISKSTIRISHNNSPYSSRLGFICFIILFLFNSSISYCDSELTIGGATSASHIIQDEGTTLRQRPYLNMTGSGITCSDASGKTTCSVSGGLASDVTTDTTEFDNNLSTTDDTVQQALETLDEMSNGLVVGGTGERITGSTYGSYVDFDDSGAAGITINEDLTLGDGSSTPTITFDGDEGTDLTIVADTVNDELDLPQITVAGIPIRALSPVNVDGINNIFMGSTVGDANTTGDENVFIGNLTGVVNNTGKDNVFLGYNAGNDNQDGNFNFFLGSNSGAANVSGKENVYLGYGVGELNVSSYNVCIGSNTGRAMTNDQKNVFLGAYAGQYNNGGNYNTFIGEFSGNILTTGDYNTAIGGEALGNGNPVNSTAIGYRAGRYAIGTGNVSIGYYAGMGPFADSTANNNTIIGTSAAEDITKGSGNIILGYMAGEGWLTSQSNYLIIENSDSATPLIFGDFGNKDITLNGSTTGVITMTGATTTVQIIATGLTVSTGFNPTSSGRAVCWNGNRLGYCSDAVGATGNCTCN